MKPLLVCSVLLLSACQSAGDSASTEAASASSADVSEAAAPAAPVVRASSGAAGPLAADAPTAPRVLIRTADLQIRVADYARARRDVAAVARRSGALVAGENEQRTSYQVSNTFVLRVPAARFDTLLDALAGIGEEVEARSVEVADVSEQSADLEARLRARRAVEARYTEILARAGSVEDVLAVEARLAETREAIEIAEGQLRGLRDRVALSTISLTLTERSATGITNGPGFGSRLAEAFAAGWDVMLGLVVGLVSLWPLWIAGALGVWAWRAVRRRSGHRDPARDA